MTKENKVFLRHILDCIGKIESICRIPITLDFRVIQRRLMQ